MNDTEIEKTAKQLDSRIPLIGGKLRIPACAKLAEDSGPLAVPHLAKALRSDDYKVAKIADNALRALKNQEAIDALCSIWENERDARLGELIATCGYVAAKPANVRVLSALKAGHADKAGGRAEAFQAVVDFLDDLDDDVKSAAYGILTSLTDQKPIDMLCEIVIARNDASVEKLVREKNYQPSNISRRCVFFLLTDQIEKYLDLDFEYQNLRAEYEMADEALKRRIAEAARRSGDARLVGLFGSRERRGGIEKRAQELDEGEAAEVLEVYTRNQRMPEIFSMLYYIPLSNVVSALDILGKSGWKPDNKQDAALLDDLLSIRKEIGEVPAASPEPNVALGTVFDNWIRAGREGDTASASAKQLRSRLRDSSPSDTVAALSALSAKGQLTSEDIEAARTHKHWSVRLACLALCEIAPEFAFSDAPVGGDSGGMWIDQLASPILDSVIYRRRCIAMNLEQVESLQGALTSKGGQNKQRTACGRVLCALGAHHLRHTIEIDEEMMVRLSETEING